MPVDHSQNPGVNPALQDALGAITAAAQEAAIRTSLTIDVVDLLDVAIVVKVRPAGTTGDERNMLGASSVGSTFDVTNETNPWLDEPDPGKLGILLLEAAANAMRRVGVNLSLGTAMKQTRQAQQRRPHRAAGTTPRPRGRRPGR